MLLAINYSTQAAALLAENRIHIDRFKCPDWPNLIAEASLQRPVGVHFTLTAGRAKLEAMDWCLVERLMNQTGTPFVNLHLEPQSEEFPEFSPKMELPDQVEQVIEHMIAEVNRAARLFGPEKVIVENVPYRGAGHRVLRPAVQPEIFSRVLEETGCGLLLDISHARIAAHYLGMDERVYMDQMPTHRLKELHFTGLHWRDNFMQDHLEALETDWPVLDWVLEQIRSGRWARPWMLAFEYGGIGEKFAWRSDPQVIAAQAPMLYQRVKDI